METILPLSYTENKRVGWRYLSPTCACCRVTPFGPLYDCLEKCFFHTGDYQWTDNLNHVCNRVSKTYNLLALMYI